MVGGGRVVTKLISHQDLVVTNQIAEWRALRNNGVIVDCCDQSDCGIA